MVKKLLGSLLVALIVSGCANMANPFVRQSPRYEAVPAEALAETARLIEEAVAQGNRDYDPADVDGVVISSPTVHQAIRTRVVRGDLVRMVLDTGFAYEQKGGLLAIKPSREYSKSSTRRERDRHALIVLEENNDRWRIYEGIVEASKFPSRSLSAVQNAFYQARVAAMPTGQKYQDESGEIVVK